MYISIFIFVCLFAYSHCVCTLLDDSLHPDVAFGTVVITASSGGFQSGYTSNVAQSSGRVISVDYSHRFNGSVSALLSVDGFQYDSFLVGNLGYSEVLTVSSRSDVFVTVNGFGYYVNSFVLTDDLFIFSHNYGIDSQQTNTDDLSFLGVNDTENSQVTLDMFQISQQVEPDFPPGILTTGFIPIILKQGKPVHFVSIITFDFVNIDTNWYNVPLPFMVFLNDYVLPFYLGTEEPFAFYIVPTVSRNEVLVSVANTTLKALGAPYGCKGHPSPALDGYRVGLFYSEPTSAHDYVYLLTQYGIGRTCNPSFPYNCGSYMLRPYFGLTIDLTVSVYSPFLYSDICSAFSEPDVGKRHMYVRNSYCSKWLKDISPDHVSSVTINGVVNDFYILDYSFLDTDTNNNTLMRYIAPLCTIGATHTQMIGGYSYGMPITGGFCVQFQVVGSPAERMVYVAPTQISWGNPSLFSSYTTHGFYRYYLSQQRCESVGVDSFFIGVSKFSTYYSDFVTRIDMSCMIQRTDFQLVVPGVMATDLAESLYSVYGSFPTLASGLLFLYRLGDSYFVNYTYSYGLCASGVRVGCLLFEYMSGDRSLKFYDSYYNNFTSVELTAESEENLDTKIEVWVVLLPIFLLIILSTLVVLLFLLYYRCRYFKLTRRIYAAGYKQVAIGYLRGERRILKMVRSGKRMTDIEKLYRGYFTATPDEKEYLTKFTYKKSRVV